MIAPATDAAAAAAAGSDIDVLRDPHRFERCYSAGELVFDRGSVGRCMYVVIDGRVDVLADPADDATLLTTLTPGACFGEIALVTEGRRTAAARAAVTPTRLAEIDKARFIYLVGQQPAFALTVLRNLARRVEALSAGGAGREFGP